MTLKFVQNFHYYTSIIVRNIKFNDLIINFNLMDVRILSVLSKELMILILVSSPNSTRQL